MYARINLSKTNYTKLTNYSLLTIQEFSIDTLQHLYKQYCDYKKFKSVIPIFNSEFIDIKNDVIGYYD